MKGGESCWSVEELAFVRSRPRLDAAVGELLGLIQRYTLQTDTTLLTTSLSHPLLPDHVQVVLRFQRNGHHLVRLDIFVPVCWLVV